jgi:DNA-binding MarR family transcriptional regulator
MALEYRGSFLLIYAVDQQLSTVLHQAMADCALTPDEFAVTSVLNLTGPVRPTGLSAQTGMRPTTLSNYLRRFEERGLVRRRTDPADGRASLVSLTAKGTRQTIACFPAFSAAITAFHDALLEEGLTPDELQKSLEVASRAMTGALERLARMDR